MKQGKPHQLQAPGWGAVLATSLAAVYISAGRALSDPSHPSLTDDWFGADIVRHAAWMLHAGAAAGAPLHPLSFLMFKAYGMVLTSLGLLHGDSPRVLFALPVVLLLSLAIPAAVGMPLTAGPMRPPRYVLGGTILVLVGPTLLFATVPESHMLGGAALLLEAVFVLRALRCCAGDAEAPRVRSYLRLAVLFAVAATGFTLSNSLPALLLFLPLPRARRFRLFQFGGPAFFLLALIWLLGVVIKHHVGLISAGPHELRLALARELQFAHLPSVPSALASFEAVVLNQFGLPYPRLEPLGRTSTVIVVSRVLYQGLRFQVPAFLLSGCGITIWLRRKHAADPILKRFILGLLGCLASIVAIHAVYATSEAYLFAAHAWPFVALPVASIMLTRNRGPIVTFLLLASLGLCLLQSCIAFLELYRLLHGG